jgi:hypothetical protein
MKPTGLSPGGLQTAGRNAVLLREAEGIATGLAARGIPALFLKGVALIESGTVELGAREMTDIDLLVRPRHLREVSAVLRSRGYAPHSNALLLHKQIGRVGLDVDLHAGLWCFGGMDPWHRSVQRSPCAALRSLCPEDALLHVILHSLVQDGVVSPRAMADCRAILGAEGERFGWEAFAATVAREGWERPVRMFLARLEAVHPGTLPPACRALGATARVLPAHGPLSGWPQWRMVRMQSRWMRKIGLLLRTLFPHPSFLAMRYAWAPRPLTFLLPVLRPVLLVAESLACRDGRSRS